MREIFFGALFAGVVMASHAQSRPPLEIKGFWLGMPKAAAVERGDLQCGLADGSFASACRKSRAGGNEATETVGGAPTILFHVNMLPNETVGSVYITFATSDFAKVRQAMAAKYRNLKCKNSTVQNRMGATFDQVECDLDQRDGTLSLSKRSGDIDTASIVLMSEEQLKQYEQEDKKKQDQAKKDL